jgi:hypothetical protein
MIYRLIVLLAVIAVAFAGECKTDENNMNSYAKQRSQGKKPDGKCYSHVADYIDAIGYGGINKGKFNNCIPPAYWQYAYQFAEYLNQGNNAANLCLKNAQSSYSNNPYNAPNGAIVVVRAGTPGTSDPKAGDIAIAGDGDHFWNGGDMTYYGSQNFPPNNNYVLGIYIPTTCTPQCPNVPKALNLNATVGETHITNPTVSVPVQESKNNFRSYIPSVMGGTCGDVAGEFCCEAPNADPNNCPSAAWTANCAKINSCCCG